MDRTTPSRRSAMPLYIQVYEYYITVDVEGVGEELLSIPLKADCQVHHIELCTQHDPHGRRALGQLCWDLF